MIFRLLADAVLVAHLGFIAFVVLGGFLALRWRWAPLVHLPAAAWGVYIEITGGICPLTPLENTLRRAAGAGDYSESFVEHYLLPIVYPASLSAETQWSLGVGLLVLSLAVYAFVFVIGRVRDGSGTMGSP